MHPPIRIAWLVILAELTGARAVGAEPPVDSRSHGESHEDEADEVVVQATRSGRRVQDEPIRVEVLVREEIEEKLLMRPGNIAVLVNETGGVRVQVTSPALGASNIRIQGMPGRYTQLLADGLPLYGGQTSSLGLLQIPPTDLGQVEVIKGSASALYGPSALGGVINLVSRRPGDDTEGELVLNATSRNGQDVTGYLASPLSGGWSYSMTGGAHRQRGFDLDEDSWRDIAGYDRWTARPRLYWQGDADSSAYLTLGASRESRAGGTQPEGVLAAGDTFVANQETRRRDIGLVGTFPFEDTGVLHLRASGMRQDHEHRYGAVADDDRHSTAFVEASLAVARDRTSWVSGFAFQHDGFRSLQHPSFDYDHRVPGVFAQVEHEISDELTIAGSARLDFHSEYGDRLSPRISALYRPGRWTFRTSLGQGFHAPTPFIDFIDATGLAWLRPLSGLTAETATAAAMEVGYAAHAWESSVTLFASDLRNTTRLEPVAASASDASTVRMVNVDDSTHIRGSELLLRYRQGDITVTGSYVFTDTDEPARFGTGRVEVPLTPRHTGAIVAMWEAHGRGRVGFEAYYTGEQTLDDNPYRTRSPDYWELGVLGEIVLGRVRLFLNVENLLDVRQTRYDPLPLPRGAADGRRAVDVWAPTEGLIVNGGIRLQL
jgi:outer membrane receptor for ferrienterochelin and colicins